MNVTEAKVALLSYCRFARQMHYVATEASVPGNALADVLASDGKSLIEYEVKVSMADLKGDSKKYKHMIYNSESIVWNGNVGTKLGVNHEIVQSVDGWRPGYYFIYVGKARYSYDSFETIEKAKEYLEEEIGCKSGAPNMLYYVIPHTMWLNNTDKILKSLNENYGVITFTGHNYHGLTVQRKAKKLHKNPVSAKALMKLAARMSSEIAALSTMHYLHSQSMTSYGKMIQEKINLDDGLSEEL